MSLSAVMNDDFFGGAMLADESCGSISLSGAFGELFTVKLDHDPEYTMSGVYDPCSSFEEW